MPAAGVAEAQPDEAVALGAADGRRGGPGRRRHAVGGRRHADAAAIVAEVQPWYGHTRPPREPPERQRRLAVRAPVGCGDHGAVAGPPARRSAAEQRDADRRGATSMLRATAYQCRCSAGLVQSSSVRRTRRRLLCRRMVDRLTDGATRAELTRRRRRSGADLLVPGGDVVTMDGDADDPRRRRGRRRRRDDRRRGRPGRGCPPRTRRPRARRRRARRDTRASSTPTST